LAGRAVRGNGFCFCFALRLGRIGFGLEALSFGSLRCCTFLGRFLSSGLLCCSCLGFGAKAFLFGCLRRFCLRLLASSLGLGTYASHFGFGALACSFLLCRLARQILGLLCGIRICIRLDGVLLSALGGRSH